MLKSTRDQLPQRGPSAGGESDLWWRARSFYRAPHLSRISEGWRKRFSIRMGRDRLSARATVRFAVQMGVRLDVALANLRFRSGHGLGRYVARSDPERQQRGLEPV